MNKFFGFLIIIAIVAGGAFFYQNWQENSYSKEDLKLEILGPSEITLGQETEYIVKYKNTGNFQLNNPEFIFEPPEQALKDGAFIERQVFGIDQLGEVIYPGQEKVFRFKMRLMGEAEDVKIIKASLSYQPQDIKARYESSSSITTKISSVPITLEFDLPSKAAAGKQFIFRINYFSNVDYLLTDLRCEVEYPFGFEFIKSSPKSVDKADWVIPVLNKSDGGRIEITGIPSGNIGSAQVFKAKLGMWREGEFIVLKEITRGVEIVEPFLYLRQEINGNPQYVALPGELLHYEIFFKNIGDDSLRDLFLVNNLEGEAFDFNTLSSDSGNHQQGDNSIAFDWKKVSKLQYLLPLEEGKIEFWVKLREDLGSVKNPILRNKVFVGQAKEEFVTKINSKMEIVQKGYFEDEVFGNSGPLPPEVGEITSYTIVWQIKNYYSNVNNVKVKAVLPENAELTGEIFPEEEISTFSFDSESREIVWSVGDVERGVGVSKDGKTLAFQIDFIPEESQQNKSPEIISEVKMTGEDSWTESTAEAISSAVYTNTLNDPGISEEMGVVK